MYLKEKSLQIKYLTENTPSFQITLEQLQKIITQTLPQNHGHFQIQNVKIVKVIIPEHNVIKVGKKPQNFHLCRDLKISPFGKPPSQKRVSKNTILNCSKNNEIKESSPKVYVIYGQNYIQRQYSFDYFH